MAVDIPADLADGTRSHHQVTGTAENWVGVTCHISGVRRTSARLAGSAGPPMGRYAPPTHSAGPPPASTRRPPTNPSFSKLTLRRDDERRIRKPRHRSDRNPGMARRRRGRHRPGWRYPGPLSAGPLGRRRPVPGRQPAVRRHDRLSQHHPCGPAAGLSGRPGDGVADPLHQSLECDGDRRAPQQGVDGIWWPYRLLRLLRGAL